MVGDVTVSRSPLPKNQPTVELIFEKTEPMKLVSEFLQDADPNGHLHPLAWVANVIFVGNRSKSPCFLRQYFLDTLCFIFYR